MSITSLVFILFVFITLMLYYIAPQKHQWCILLISSVVFYLLSSLEGAVFVLITSISVYSATLIMQNMSDKRKAYLKEHKNELSKDEKEKFKSSVKRKRKAVFLFVLLLNLGLLCFFKYFHFVFEQIGNLISMFGYNMLADNFSFIIPLGISFYTFQSVGYLVNIYWENYKPERNYLKLLLFMSFFPQITQGPISEFEQLSKELFKAHNFSYKNFSWGFQRVLWGLMKKMIIANSLAPWVEDVFANYQSYTGITTLLGAFMYSVQIYADFSGYMDIMCGFCEMFDIKLAENFERPYFSKSIAEYWRRWHITLGAWFKQYIYYPIAVSKWNRNLGKKLTQKFGNSVGKNFPATIALIVVWFTTGLWHGASWAYIAWGGVNGLFIIFSMWMEPVYEKGKQFFRINESKWHWKAFQTIRTFILVTFIKVLPEVGSLSQGFGLWKRIFTEHTLPESKSALIPFVETTEIGNFLIVCVLIFLLFLTSLLQRKMPIREYFNRAPIPVRFLLLIFLTFLIIMIGVPVSQEGAFLYEGF